jgi:hypothetical protein
MKNLNRIFGIVILAAVIAFTMASCGEGAGSGSGGGGSGGGGGETVFYTGCANTVDIYALAITQKADRAVYSPKTGDTYVLTIYTTKLLISSGTVTVNGSTITLSKGGIVTITSNGVITAISGTIELDEGEPLPAPDNITSVAPDSDLNGTWKSESYEDVVYIVKFDNGILEYSPEGSHYIKAFYFTTYKEGDGNILIFIPTHVYGSGLNGHFDINGVKTGLEAKWYTKPELEAALSKLTNTKVIMDEEFEPFTWTYTRDSTTLTLSYHDSTPGIYIKQ